MTKIQELLNKNTNNIYNKFDRVELKVLDELYNYYNSDINDDKRKQKEKRFYPLVKYIINNNTLDLEVLIGGTKYNKDNFDIFIDDRIEHFYNMIRRSIKYALKKGLEVPNTILYIWISDRYPWYSDYDNRFPIYVASKPTNSNYLLIPDNTFECLTMSEKYRGMCSNWKHVKKIIIDECGKTKFNNKINKIYFKGTSTTKKNSQIREKLEIYSNNNKWLDVKLDAWKSFTSIENFCKYKFLLNLPGHFPWSNRFKYLFLMNSVVINVDVNSYSLEGKFNELAWQTVINYIVEPNKHYINIEMNYYFSKENVEEMNRLNKIEFDKVVNQLDAIYKYKDNVLNDIVTNGYNRVSKLKQKHIHMYIYNCIIQNSKVNFV